MRSEQPEYIQLLHNQRDLYRITGKNFSLNREIILMIVNANKFRKYLTMYLRIS